MTRERPPVSVVIPTYNSAETLETCLRSLEEQSYPNLEVIVVDDHSEDATPEIAEEHGVTVVQTEASMTEARNEGIRRADGTYLLSIDADMELSPGVISACVETMTRDESIGGIVIPERSVGDSLLATVRDFERQFYAGTDVESARFFRTEPVVRVGGYDDSLVFFEDSTLPQKLADRGYDTTERVEPVIFHHEEGVSLLDWLAKKFEYGKSAPRYKEKYESTAARQTDPVARLGIFLERRGLFFSRPLLAFGTLCLKFLEYLATQAGMLSTKFELSRREVAQ